MFDAPITGFLGAGEDGRGEKCSQDTHVAMLIAGSGDRVTTWELHDLSIDMMGVFWVQYSIVTDKHPAP